MREQSYRKYLFWILSGISLFVYFRISYQTPRHESLSLLLMYSLLFLAYILSVRLIPSPDFVRYAYYAGFLFRISLLFLVPNLSDDIYRFIWDGRLTANGINPYGFSPEEILSNPEYRDIGMTQALFDLFGKNTYSSYPPFAQIIFGLSAIISPDSTFGSIIVIRLVILAFEAGNLVLLGKLLKANGLPAAAGLLYALNPLVILELSGNLHFEGIMIFFLLLSMLFLHDGKYIRSGLALGMGILTKLLPLILLPFIWYRFKQAGKKITISALVLTIAGFLPFSGIIATKGFLSSLALYFYKLEFNAGIYFLIRQAGYWITGINIIWVAGPMLGLAALLLIIWFSFSRFVGRLKTAEAWMWLFLIYMAFTTTLHPWYIITLVALSLLTGYRFPVVWSFFIFLTYQGYTKTGYEPNYWLIGLEYVAVYAVMVVEIWKVRAERNASGV